MTCTRCGGDGYINVINLNHHGTVIDVRPCPDCDGTGEIDRVFTDEIEPAAASGEAR